MNVKGSDYRAYLLRLWQVDQNGNRVLRCSLEESTTGQRKTFADLETMTVYLKDRMGIHKEEKR